MAGYRYARLADGTQLRFPAETPDEVVHRTVKARVSEQRANAMFPPEDVPAMSPPMPMLDTVVPATSPEPRTVAETLAPTSPPPERRFGSVPGFSPGERERLLGGVSRPPAVPQGGYEEVVEALGPTPDLGRAGRDLPEAEDPYWRENFNTPLSPEDEEKFQEWLVKKSAALGRDVSLDIGDYDVRGGRPWEEEDVDERGHGSDRHKKPNHPTFSNESIYHGKNGFEGGHWGDGTFTAGKSNLDYYGEEHLRRYMKEVEPGVKLIIPKNLQMEKGPQEPGPEGQQVAPPIDLLAPPIQVDEPEEPVEPKTPMSDEEQAFFDRQQWLEDSKEGGEISRGLKRSMIQILSVDESTRKYLRASGINARPTSFFSPDDYKRIINDMAQIPKPDSWYGELAENAPLSALLMVPAVMGGVAAAGAGAGAFTALGVAGLFGVLPEAVTEAGGVYQALLDQGLSPEEAKKKAHGILADNVALLTITNMAGFGGGALTAKIGTKGLAKFADKFADTFAKRAMAKVVYRTAATGAGVAATMEIEGWQEWAQEGFAQAAEGEAGVFDNTERQKEAKRIGRMIGALFGIVPAVTGTVQGAAEDVRAAAGEGSVPGSMFDVKPEVEQAAAPAELPQEEFEPQLVEPEEGDLETPQPPREEDLPKIGKGIEDKELVKNRRAEAKKIERLKAHPGILGKWARGEPGFTNDTVPKILDPKGKLSEEERGNLADELAEAALRAERPEESYAKPEEEKSVTSEEAPAEAKAEVAPVTPEPEEALSKTDTIPTEPNQADKEARVFQAEKALEAFRRDAGLEAAEEGGKAVDLMGENLDKLRELEGEYDLAKKEADATRPKKEKREISDEEREYRGKEIDDAFEGGTLIPEEVKPGREKTFEEKKQEDLFGEKAEVVEEKPKPKFDSLTEEAKNKATDLQIMLNEATTEEEVDELRASYKRQIGLQRAYRNTTRPWKGFPVFNKDTRWEAAKKHIRSKGSAKTIPQEKAKTDLDRGIEAQDPRALIRQLASDGVYANPKDFGDEVWGEGDAEYGPINKLRYLRKGSKHRTKISVDEIFDHANEHGLNPRGIKDAATFLQWALGGKYVFQGTEAPAPVEPKGEVEEEAAAESMFERDDEAPEDMPTGGTYEPFSVGKFADPRPESEQNPDPAPNPAPAPDEDTAGPQVMPQRTYNRDVFRVATPELVELAKVLGRGRYPRIRRALSNLRAQGVFRAEKGKPGSGRMELLASIFADPNQAAATLAHEIGHWIDFLPEGNFARGNILGRIAGLSSYLRSTITKHYSDPVEFITEKDRARLRRQAKKESKVEYEEEVDEYIEKTTGLTPEDVTSIWNNYTPTAPEELIDYIKHLDTPQIKAIVKAAMQGMIHEDLKRFVKITRELTGKKKKVKRTVYQDPAKKFRELLFEEIKKRNMVNKADIWSQAYKLSLQWRPMSENPTPQEIKYRKDGKEVYADLISVLLNDPALLRETAPDAYEILIGWMQQKAEFAAAWNEFQAMMSDSDNIDDHRLKNYKEAMRDGAKKSLEQLTKQPERMSTAQAILKTFMERSQAFYRLRNLQKKAGTYDPATDPVLGIEEMMYNNSRAAWYLDVWNSEFLMPLREVISEIELGAWMGLKRAAVRVEEGGRSTLANPLGLSDEYAQRVLDRLKSKFTPAQQQVVMESMNAYAELRKELFDLIEESGAMSSELLGLLRNSVHAYSTYRAEAFMSQIPDGYIHVQIGMLGKIGNPLIETALKDLAMMEWAQRSMTIRQAVDYLEAHDPESVKKAQKDKRNKKFLDAKIARDVDSADFDLVLWWEEGKLQGAYVKKAYADGLKSPIGKGQLWSILLLPTRVFRATVVDHNPFWAISNLHRDMRAFMKKLPVETVRVNIPLPGGRVIPVIDPLTPVLRATKYLLKALPDAWKDVYLDTRTPVVRQMLKEESLIQSGVRFWRAADLGEEEMHRLLLESHGLVQEKDHTLGGMVLQFLGRHLSAPGAVTERAVKIAGRKFLHDNKKRLGLSDREIASLVRRRAGTPDIIAGGSAKSIYNSLFLFSNVAIQDNRSAFEAMAENPAIYAQKLFYYTIVPKMMMRAAASGLLGAWFAAAFRRIPEYDKENFQCIPLWFSGGKIVYLRMPEDHFSQAMGAIFWVMTADKEKFKEYWHILNNNFPFAAGNLNPFIDEMVVWTKYLEGQNPTDSYRGRPVIPERVFNSGDQKMIRGYMLRHTWNSLGGRVFYRFSYDDKDPASTFEKITKIPGLQLLIERFIKVSDYGLHEELRETTQPGREEQGAGYLYRDRKIKELLRSDPEASARAVADKFISSDVDPAYKDDKDDKKLMKRIDLLRMRYYGDPFQSQMSLTRDKEQRELIEKMDREDRKQMRGKR
jgi:hypothetical protein